MFTSLLTGLTSLRDFLSRGFFIAAFLPTLMLFVVNAVILFFWSWPVHDWVRDYFLAPSAWDKAVTLAVLFFAAWIASYAVAALTPLWTRTLEGRNWWTWLAAPGREFHSRRYEGFSRKIEEAVRIYVDIGMKRPGWNEAVIKATSEAAHPAKVQPLAGAVSGEIDRLKRIKNSDQILQCGDLDNLVLLLAGEIKVNGITKDMDRYLSDLTLLIEYAQQRAQREHLRLLNERNLEFGDREEIAPTRFGNVGLSAQAYAMRAYNCNLGLIWSSLRRAAEKDESAGKALENCKIQLDFLVAGFWLSLVLAMGWTLVFALSGEVIGALSALVAGPLVCWAFWYGAGVEQYRLLQGLIVSYLQGPPRFQVLSDLRLGLPSDIVEERDLWRALDCVIGFGEAHRLRYEHPKS